MTKGMFFSFAAITVAAAVAWGIVGTAIARDLNEAPKHSFGTSVESNDSRHVLDTYYPPAPLKADPVPSWLRKSC